MQSNTYLIPPENDPMGQAIADYHRTGKAKRLIVTSTMFDDDEMPVDVLFRGFDKMPAIEQEALRLAQGNILDVGAGSGCHALALEQMGKKVCAIDISQLSVDVMRRRGVKDARAVNLFDERLCDRFDTILLLMNGAGMMQRMENMPMFFSRMRQLLAPGGKILMDSSDLIYIYEDEDGSVDIDLNGDMALIGRPIKGRIIATRPGHTINNKFARQMRREIRKYEVQAPNYDPNSEPFKEINPFRTTYLLPELSDTATSLGVKTLHFETTHERQFQTGHH